MVNRASAWPPVLSPYGRRYATQVDTHTVRGADGVVRIHLKPYSAVAKFRQAPEMLHLAAYLRPKPCEATQRLLGERADGARWAENASVISAAALGAPAGLVLDRLMTQFPAGWIASVIEPDRCRVAVRTSLHHEDVPHGLQFVLTPDSVDAFNPLWLYGVGGLRMGAVVVGGEQPPAGQAVSRG